MVEREEVIKRAKLSKLNLSDEVIDKLTAEMQSIISFADMISKGKCDFTDVLADGESPALREDTVRESYSNDDILKNAPTRDGNYFLLPRRDV